MLKGVLAVVLASFAYGILPALTKLALSSGLSADSIVLFRFLLSGIFAFIVLKMQKVSLKINKKQFLHLIIFGILGFGLTINLMVSSYVHIPTGISMMLHFSYPLFSTFAMVLFFKEKCTIIKVISCFSALSGILLMADFSTGLSLIGVFLALCSGITYASFIIANRKSHFSQLPPLLIIFYVCIFSSVVFGIKGLLFRSISFPTTLMTWGVLATTALVCTVFSLTMLTVGIRLLGVSTASILNMLEPVTSVLCGFLFFSENLSNRSLAGCTFIILSSVIIVFGNHKKHQSYNKQNSHS